MTLAETVLLMICGMSFWEALAHSFSTLGTGGFSSKNASIGGYNSASIEWVCCIFMALSGINFSLYFQAFTGKIKSIFENTELKVYIVLLLVCITGITIFILPQYKSFSTALRLAAFQVVTIVSTTGFATADFTLWAPSAQFIIFILMFVGGCSGSTGGGFKVSRVIILVRTAKRNLRKLLHPKSVNVVKSDDKSLNIETVHGVSCYLIIYLLIFIASRLIISLNNMDFTSSFTSVTTCFNNIGPGLSKVGPTCNFSELSNLSKYTLSLDMLLGRLECIPILMMFAPSMWIKKLY